MKIRIPKPNSLKFLLWASFIISILIETFVVMDSISDNQITKAVQYFVLLTPVIFCIVNRAIIRNGHRNSAFWDEMKSGLIVAICFLLLSLYRSVTQGKFSIESIIQVCQIFIPFLFAYILVNELTENDIVNFMKFALLLTILGYFSVLEVDDFTNLFKISFINSYSPFENSSFAEVASGLSAFFIYFRKKMPGYALAAVLLNFLIFKRVFVLMVVVLLVISLLDKQDQVVSKKLKNITLIFWPAIIGFVYYLYQPDTVQLVLNRFNFDIVRFTMARIYRLWYVLENNFISYGLGSTTEFINAQRLSYIGYEFEMDFVRIIFEIGFMAIVVFVYEYLKITKRNNYCFWLINMCFLNLLMANGLVRYWGWTFRFITIALINYGDKASDGSV